MDENVSKHDSNFNDEIGESSKVALYLNFFRNVGSLLNESFCFTEKQSIHISDIP